MKDWVIPITWECFSKIVVEADSLEEAMEIARDKEGVIPIPDDSDYVDGSWRLSEENESDIRNLYNQGQEDEEKHEQ